MMILVNGGSSSGKSAFAESLILEQDKRERAEENKTCPSWYLATMIAWDEECRERIRKHQNMRAEKNFRTNVRWILKRRRSRLGAAVFWNAFQTLRRMRCTGEI